MSKRHVLDKNEWSSVFKRLEELVLANSGEDEFEEIFKIILVKLYTETVDEEFYDKTGIYSSNCSYERTCSLLQRAMEKWPDIIEGPPEIRLSPEHLLVCMDVLDGVRLSDENFEVLDSLFEFLSNQSSKGSKGQYFTPRQVIDFCVEILDPKPDETVVDPACGSGGFLIHALNHVEARYGVEKSRYAKEKLWGFDFEARAVRVAKALLLMAGGGHANIDRLNSLAMPDLFSTTPEVVEKNSPRVTIEDVIRAKTRNFKGFDIILTNPPFAGEIKEKRFLDSYELASGRDKIERDALFIERCVGLLRPGGRIAIVLPHNKVGGHSWATMRRWLLMRVQITAVLGLGRNTFLPHTSQKASVVFGIKRPRVLRRMPSESIKFLINERDGKDSKGQVIEREGATFLQPAWQRVDHDLDELAKAVKGANGLHNRI